MSTTSQMKNILVLSDVHYGDLAHLNEFGKSGVSSDEEFRSIADGVIRSIPHQIDFIFVLGDLTSRGSPGEFQDFYRFLSILRDKLKLEQTKVFITYGNHDVDWSISSLKQSSPEHNKAYCIAAANIGGIFAPPGSYTVNGPVIGCGIAHLEGIDLISLNSGIECYSDQEIKHGRLGQVQFDWLKRDLSKHLRDNATKIVILHHHLYSLPYAKPVHDLSALEEGANVLEILGLCGVDVVMHGHRHHPIVHTMSASGWKKPMTFFCAGSFGVSAHERAHGKLPNTFHIVSISAGSGIRNVEGKIETFELNSSNEWIPLEKASSEYSINQQHWFGEPNARQTAEAEIGQMILNARTALTKSDYLMLPHYDKLPLCLRCLNLKELNDLLQSKCDTYELSVTGDYPANCIITKVMK